MKHVRSLDSLRGLLSLFVVASHAWQVFSLPQTGETWANIVFGFPARAAVLCFFCLSGFVIAMSIRSNRQQNGSFSLARYGLSRIDRIVPPFLGVVLLTWLMAIVLTANGATEVALKGAARPVFFADPLGQLMSLATLTIHGQIEGLTGGLLNGPVWSLVFEIQLYVIAGLVAFALDSAGRVPILAMVLLVAFVAVFGIQGLKLRTLSYIAFGLGALAFVLREVDRKYVVIAFCKTQRFPGSRSK